MFYADCTEISLYLFGDVSLPFQLRIKSQILSTVFQYTFYIYSYSHLKGSSLSVYQINLTPFSPRKIADMQKRTRGDKNLTFFSP